MVKTPKLKLLYFGRAPKPRTTVKAGRKKLRLPERLLTCKEGGDAGDIQGQPCGGSRAARCAAARYNQL